MLYKIRFFKIALLIMQLSWCWHGYAHDLFPSLPPDLADLAAYTDQTRNDALPGDSLRERFLGAINRSGIHADSISLELFDGQKVEIIRDEFIELGKERQVLIGHLASNPAANVIIAQTRDSLVAKIVTDDFTYSIMPTSQGGHILQEWRVDQLNLGKQKHDAVSLPTEFNSFQSNPKDDGSVIDIMMVYSVEQQNTMGADGVQALIDSQIAETNYIFRNSEIPTFLRYVGKTMVDWHTPACDAARREYNSSADSLLYVLQNNDDGCMDSVHIDRDRLRADLVAAITGNVAGVAFIGGPFSITTRFTPGLYTFGHELGHNLGACNDGDYQFGGVNSCDYVAMMQYDLGGCQNLGNSSRYIPYFSNPDVKYAGLPTGYNDESLRFNCSRKIKDRLVLSANYRWSRDVETAPIAPQPNLTKTGNDSVRLNWSVPTDNSWDGVLILYRKDGGIWQHLWQLPATTTSYTHKNMIHGSRYEFKMSSFSGAGQSPASEVIEVIIPPTLPGYATVMFPPDGIFLSNWVGTRTSYYFQWSPVPNVSQQELWVGKDPQSLALLVTLDANAHSYTDANRQWDADSTYYWRIDQINAYGRTLGSVNSFKTRPVGRKFDITTLDYDESRSKLIAQVRTETATPQFALTEMQLLSGNFTITSREISPQTYEVIAQPIYFDYRYPLIARFTLSDQSGAAYGGVISYSSTTPAPTWSGIQPANLAEISSNKLDLRWNPLNASARYKVLFGDHARIRNTIATNVDAKHTSIPVNALQADTRYYWQISATGEKSSTQFNDNRIIIVYPTAISPNLSFMHKGGSTEKSWQLLNETSQEGLNHDPQQQAVLPNLVTWQGRAHAIWSELSSNIALQIRVAAYDEGQKKWQFIDGNQADHGLNANADYSGREGRLAVHQNELYAIWLELQAEQSNWQVRAAKYSADDGQWRFWGNGEGILNFDRQKPALKPNLVSCGGELYASWGELADTLNYTIRLSHYNQESQTWQFLRGVADESILNHNPYNPARDVHLQATESGGQCRLLLTWIEFSNRAWQVRAATYDPLAQEMTFIDGNDLMHGLNRNPRNEAKQPQIASNGQFIYLMWTEKNNARVDQIRVMRAAVSNPSQWSFVDGDKAESGLNLSPTRSALQGNIALNTTYAFASWIEPSSSGVPTLRSARQSLSGSSDGSWEFLDGGTEDKGLNLKADAAAADSVLYGNGDQLYLLWSEKAGSRTKRIHAYRYDTTP